MPEPFSSKIGFGRKVALLPAARATFLTMYLCVMSVSAMRSNGWKRRSISPWPGPPTSWWWNSQGTSSASSVITISERRLPSVSWGGNGVRHQEHVRLGDLLKAADRGAVEAEPVAERILLKAGDRQRHVLPGARHVRELEVDHAHAQLLGHLEHVARTGVGLACELL